MHYVDIFNSTKYNFCIWIIPKNCRIKLHDHPMMYALTKILYGRLKFSSFAWENNQSVPDLVKGHLMGGYAFGKTWFSETDSTSYLTPQDGNIHEVTAETNVAFIDLFFPPYDKGKGRDCQYFDLFESDKATGLVNMDKPIVASALTLDKTIPYFLKPSEPPAGFFTVQLPYTGQKVEMRNETVPLKYWQDLVGSNE